MNSENWLEEHSRFPYHRGLLEDHSPTASVSSTVCGDVVTLQMRSDGQSVRELRHMSSGCLVCQSSASFICSFVEGWSFGSVRELTQEDYLDILGPLSPMRQTCALLAFRCLELLIEE